MSNGFDPTRDLNNLPPPPQGYAPPPQGFAPPPQGYAPPPKGKRARPRRGTWAVQRNFSRMEQAFGTGALGTAVATRPGDPNGALRTPVSDV
jgi:hypothetical protein